MSLRIFNKSSKHLNNATKVMSITSLVLQSKRGGYWNGIYLGPGHIDIDLSDGATKPDGVPETWTSIDIPNVDFGKFDEDCFPPALVKILIYIISLLYRYYHRMFAYD